MEAFSLLKYWRGGGAALPLPVPAAPATTPTAILTAVAQNDVESETDDDEGDDGPFFDLEFTLPEESPQNSNGNTDRHSELEENSSTSEDEDDEEEEDDSVSDGESEIKFTLSPSSNDPDRSSDGVVFKGKLVQLVEPSSEPNSKPNHQFTASFLKSANKFRVFNLGLKKPKPNNSGKDPNPKQQRKLFTVKFKVEEVPIVSLFTRDNSSKGAAKSVTASANKNDSPSQSQSLSSVSEEKRSVHKYLRMVKPLYVRVSRRYADKLRFSGQINVSDSAAAEKEGDGAVTEAAAGANGKGQRQGNLPLPAGLRVVCKHLGKSRSASSVEAAAAELVSSKRRDDSLLQQQDGIQGAILHCKRSFNASRECESSQLPRSVSDPLHEVSSSPELSRKSTNEGK